MKIYSQFLDDESLCAIKEITTSNFGSLLCPSVEIRYGSSILEVTGVSIQIAPKKYLIISNDWSDSPIEAHDYYFLEARISNEPYRISFRDEGHVNYTLVNVPFHFHLGGSVSAAKISVLEYGYTGNQERVEYDAGLLIELSNGKIIAIVRVESISGFLNIAHKPEDIENLTAELHPRIVINA